MRTFEKPIVVISKCIEFAPCRWNGIMIKNSFVEKLKSFVDFYPICPEVEIGLGIPRKSIRLVKNGDDIRLLQNETSMDFTKKMIEFSDSFLAALGKVDGFILKDRSPSCGNKDAKVYPSLGKVAPITGHGNGIFGGKVVEKFGHLAVENEGRLNNFRIREHFLTRLFAIAHFREKKKNKSIKNLIDFHGENKYMMMGYNQTIMRKLGNIVANHEKKTVDMVWSEYEKGLYKIYAKMPRFTSNINVLMHCFGYFSKNLTSDEKAYFLDTLEAYRENKVPLSVPIALLRSWVIRFDQKYLRKQTFFSPYPSPLIEITDSGKGRGV